MNVTAAIKTINFNRTYTVLIALWVLTMISLPIVRFFSDEATFNWGVSFSVLIQTAAVVAILHDTWGWGRTLRTAAIVAVLGWGIEFIGSRTGLPFGAYNYTEALQPQLGHVPLLIPLAWFMMLPPAWAIAERVVGTSSRLRFILFSAAAFTAWDLFLDPQMVHWGYWVWENPQGYFGIPWINYLGWFLTATVMTVAVRPDGLPLAPLLLIYAITWALESIGLIVFWGLVGPGLVGFVGMGLFVWLGWRALRKGDTRAT